MLVVVEAVRMVDEQQELQQVAAVQVVIRRQATTVLLAL
jgi:predicted DNA-binding protein (UPF0251 family)